MLISIAITANAILKGTINDQSTYSIYYGQQYSLKPTPETLAARQTAFGKPSYIIFTNSDLGEIPKTFDIEDIIDYFDEVFSDSSIKVYGIVNIVYLFRKLYKGTKFLPSETHLF